MREGQAWWRSQMAALLASSAWTKLAILVIVLASIVSIAVTLWVISFLA